MYLVFLLRTEHLLLRSFKYLSRWTMKTVDKPTKPNIRKDSILYKTVWIVESTSRVWKSLPNWTLLGSYEIQQIVQIFASYKIQQNLKLLASHKNQHNLILMALHKIQQNLTLVASPKIWHYSFTQTWTFLVSYKTQICFGLAKKKCCWQNKWCRQSFMVG